MAFFSLLTSLVGIILLGFVSAFAPIFPDGSDLTNFVTYPEIKAPLLDVEIHDREALDAGYWFLGPYGALGQSSPHPSLYYPCQNGPHIYDQDGELVWSGACKFENRVACDFRVVQANGTSFLSAIVLPADPNDLNAHAVIMDDSYSVVDRFFVQPGTHPAFNMHEFTLVNGGSRILYISSRPLYIDMTGVLNDTNSGWIVDLGIHEVDVATGKVTFEWWSSDHIDLTESSAPVRLDATATNPWDWIHVNSVNKNDDGDYIVSARNTNCIYKIFGKNGTILWRLGGTESTFDLIDFDFSRQHDAQWVAHGDDIELISFLDNGGDNYGYSTSSTSSALIVRLDKTADPPRATVVERIQRPDGGKSHLRGNFQILPNGNRLAGWSDNAYFTEHAPDGRHLMQAQFRTKRFVTYRAYKFQFEGFPTEPPRVHANAYSAGESRLTVFFVSWNGATNVARWRFWRVSETGSSSVIGEVQRTGFETSFQSEGCEERVYAEALDHDGTSLGRTEVFEIESPGFVQSRASDSPGKDEL